MYTTYDRHFWTYGKKTLNGRTAEDDPRVRQSLSNNRATTPSKLTCVASWLPTPTRLRLQTCLMLIWCCARLQSWHLPDFGMKPCTTSTGFNAARPVAGTKLRGMPMSCLDSVLAGREQERVAY